MASATEAVVTATDSTLSPQADSGRKGFFRGFVDNFVSQGAHSRLSFVVIGETGQGKSTLINGLAGQQIAKEGHDFDERTTGLDRFQLNQNDVQLEFWDTPCRFRNGRPEGRRENH